MTASRNGTAALFLFAALILGGSAQGAWGLFLLHLGAIALLVVAINSSRARPMGPWARRLAWLAAAAVGLLLIQLIPLPPALWTALPGRAFVADGLAMLGQPAGWMSWSLAPYSTLAAGFALLVPIGMFAAIVRRPDSSRRLLVAALLAGTFAGCLLGVMQVASGGERWYLYRFSAFGASTGFFANSNHLGTLLLASAPFLVAIASEGADSNRDAQARGVIRAAAAAGALLLVVSIVLNGSLAVQLLGLPVVLACIAMLGQGRTPGQRRILGIAALGAIAAAALLLVLVQEQPGLTSSDGFSTRSAIWTTTLAALREAGVAGSGFGTFADYYRVFENAADVTPTFVNHAHNDYLELIVEGGAAAAALIILFLAWWAAVAVRTWRATGSDIYARAASIASATLLLHSLVDYPLRTAALSALFGMCLALMCLRSPVPAGSERTDLRPTRHRTLR